MRSGQSPGVLVVDDDHDIRQTLHWLLDGEGYHVLEARDGAAALELLRSSAGPLVVVLDQLMPRMTGLELLLQVEADPLLAGRDRYILLSAMSPVQVRGADDTLERLDVARICKPFDVDQLLEAIGRAGAHLLPSPVLQTTRQAPGPHGRPLPRRGQGQRMSAGNASDCVPSAN